ncbi:DNA polymerase III subunit beta [Paenibacillus sp. FSL W7-1279]|uniref:DNA polymerase III subunit beta n=1 Tax=unclassified Paenibacillus TaxID=185978 RepID=UPI001C7CD4CF|nr:DNA polymerase III subunit beta [Paenibacillus lautus]
MNKLLVHISRDLLAKAVQHVYKAVSSNSPVSRLSGLYIQAGREGVFFSGSNTSLTVQYKVCITDSKVRILNKGSVVCPGKYLFEIIRKLEDGNVTLEVNEHLVLSISSENTRVCLSGMSPIEYPFIRPPYYHQSANYINVSCNLFISVINQVAGAASTSEAKPILTGVSLEIQGNQLNLIATDGVIRMAALSICIENEGGVYGSVVIPGGNLMEIAKILADDGLTKVTIELNHHEIRFMTQNLLINSVLIEGMYPSTRNLVPASHVSEIVLNIKSLRQMVDRVSVLADYHLVTMHVTENKLELTSSTPEIGDVSDVLLLEDKIGDNFSITINVKYLISTLRCIESDSIRVRFAGRKSPIVLLPALEDRACLFLLSPVMTR